MKFTVYNRFSGDPQFVADIDCVESAPRSVKLGLAVNLASLDWASLDGASLNGANGVNDWVKCIQIEQYPICYTDTVIQIGCERHLISEWAEFDDKRIAEMNGKDALKFWRKYKTWIFQTIELCPAKPTQREAA